MILNINKTKLLLLSVLASIVIVAVVLGLVFGLRSRDGGDSAHDEPVHGRLTGGAVTSNGLECAEIGASILRQNGTAVDAAIATLFCEGVTCPQSMGLGGGFLATIYIRETGTAESLDSREVAPAAAKKDMFVNRTVTGGLAVAVPGEVKGYWTLHQRYGRLEWKSLVEPTIKLCREGHIVTGYLERILAGRTERIRNEPTLRDVFINPATQQPWKEGDRLKRLALADSLEIIATEGVHALYSRNGTLLPKLMRDLKLLGSIITEDDFYNYEPRWLAPVQTSIRNSSQLYSIPLPGSGAVLTYMLNILDNFDGPMRSDDPLSWHQIVESFKHGYGLRSRLGDPPFVPGIEDQLHKLSSKAYAQYIHETIANDRTHSDYAHYGAEFSSVPDQGTAHVSVLAPNGDAVSVTSTINSILGAMVRSTSTGIVLNDEMDDFSTPGTVNGYGLPASPANFIVPGKRPMSSMTPTIITDSTGDVRIVVGSAGGSRITTATMQLIVRHLVFGESLETIIRAPRLHHQLAPMSVEYEQGFDTAVIAGLQARGHICNESPSDGGFAALTAIIRYADNRIEATYDPRRSGSTAILTD